MRRFSLFTPALSALALVAFTAPGHAQSNQIPGLNVILGFLDGMDDLGHIGTFPTGRAGFSMSTTSCNTGTVEATWEQAMDPDHPFIAFVIARESGGRMEQISDHSYVKHGFFALSSNQCGLGCSGTDGTALGIGCSDTYGVGTNGSQFWLGPPTEINPWLGTWNPICSLFDGPDCDGQRDFNGGGLTSVDHRVEVEDSDLNVGGANFFYQAMYVVQSEPEGNRGDNLGWRPVTINWNGSGYSVSPGGSSTPTYGSVLDAWTGATVRSNTNGSADGRVYVATRTAPAGPNTHYEYAVHNRDSERAVSSFSVPLAPGTNVSNIGFHDIDQDGGNQWTSQVVGNELVFSTTSNPIMWNSIFNFWFDADSSPQTSVVTVEPFFGGAGAPEFSIVAEVPGGGQIDPCAQPDDAFEPNDTCAAAAPVGESVNASLFIEKTDDDWYQITLMDQETLTADVIFTHANGDLDIELFDACGQPLIDNSDTITDDEQVSVTNNSGGAQNYFLRVYVFANSAEDCNNYTLDVDISGGILPMGCDGEDALEPNDSCAGALAMAAGTSNNLTVQKTDDDWYAVDVAPGASLTVTMSFTDANGDLDMQLFDTCGGGVIDSSESTSDSETVNVTNNGVSNNTYFVRSYVWGGAPENCNDYSLTISLQGGNPMGCDVADSLENNDTCGNALALGAGTQSNLTVQQTDQDWYAITVPGGGTLTVDMLFSDASGDLDLAIHDTCGSSALQISQSTSDDEQVSVVNGSGSPNTYFVNCYVWSGAPESCNGYDLVVDIVNPNGACGQPDDGFEPNDSCPAGANIGAGSNPGLYVTKTDPDWYEVSVADQAALTVDVLFSHATADVDVYLFDACGGTQLDLGFSADDNEQVSWTNNTGQTAQIQMRVEVWPNSVGDCNNYDLNISIQGGAPTNLLPFCFGDGSGTNCPCNNDSTAGHPGGCANSGGEGAILVGTGDPSSTNDTLAFNLSSATPFSFGILVSADNQLNGGLGILGMPALDGLRCVGGNLFRHGVRPIGASGTNANPWGLGGAPAGGLVNNAGFFTGQVRNFQVFFREIETKVCGTGQNTSNAIEVTVTP